MARYPISFDSNEISDILRRFEQKNKKAMTERDWNDYIMSLEHWEYLARESKMFTIDTLVSSS